MKLIKKMTDLGLEPKKEFIKLSIIEAVIFLIGGVFVYFLKNPIYLAFIVILGFLFAFIYLTRYNSQITLKNQKNIEDFAIIFSYFRIYIRNGFSVYSALKEILVFANTSLRKLMEILIEDIDSDKSVQPFVKFAKNFDEIIVEEMMISIYQMIDDGEQSEYLRQFELIFDKFSDVLYQKNLHKKDSKLGTIGSSPLVGSCFIIIVLTIGIVSIMGDMINGI